MTAAIVRGDALRLPLADGSVDLIVTSPPYFALRSYRDGDEHYGGQIGSEDTPAAFLRALWAVLDECWRVLKPTGSCWVNLGDKYAGSGGHNNNGLTRSLPGVGASYANGSAHDGTRASTRRTAPDRYNQAADVLPKSVMGLPWRFALGAACPDPYRTVYDPGHHPQWINRRPLVWHKPNGLPESVTDRCRANFEDWFMLVKQGRYFSAVDEIREPYTPGMESRYVNGFGVTKRNAAGASHNAMDRSMLAGDGGPTAQNPLGKLPGSVWTVATEPLLIPDSARDHYQLPDHFAAFPQEWPRRIILGWSPSGICTACGEGRRPVVSSERVKPPAHGPRSTTGKIHGDGPNDHRATGERFDRLHVVTGHACACPEPSAPTRPAVILDPFSGTGTVAGVANALGRTGIGVDLSGDYCRLAQWRTQRSGHFAKTASRTDAERQGSLLDAASGGTQPRTVTVGP